MSSQPVDHLHPVLDFAHRLRERLDSMAQVPLWSMTAGAAARRPDHPPQAQAQLDALEAATARRGRPLRRHHRDRCRHSRRLDRGRNPAGPPRSPLRPPPRRSTGAPRRAVGGDGRGQGQHRPGPRHRGRARQAPHHRRVRRRHRATQEPPAHLVAMAEHHDAKALRILGGRIFEVIAPDLAEKFDGKALEAEEAEALRRTTLTMWEDDEGTCHGRFRIPALHGQMLTKMILAISSPSPVHQRQPRLVDRHRPRPAHPGPPRHRAHPADRDLPRREAAEDRWLLRHRRGHHDPRTAPGRPRPRRGLHPGHRRPHLRGRGPPSRVHRRDHPRRPRREEPGPRRRPQTPPAHRSHANRDGRARRRLHRRRAAKHLQASATPTTTDRGPQAVRPASDTGRLLCPHHHRRVHDPKYETRHLPGGKVSFHRRT